MKRLRPRRLPNQLKVLRARFGVTQTQVAFYIGVDPADYNRIERGKRQPSPEQREALATLFSTAPEAIFTSDSSQAVAS